MAKKAGGVFVEVFADDRRFMRGIRRVNARLRQFVGAVRAAGARMSRMAQAGGQAMKRLGRSIQQAAGQLRGFGTAASTAGQSLGMLATAGAAPIAIATRIFASFDDQMRVVQAVTGATGDQFDELTAKAKELGRTTSFTAAEVAAGMAELGRAGFKPDAINASIESVLNLARATDTDLAEAAQIAGSALRQYNLDVSESGRVADVLTTAANSSAMTLTDLSESLKYVGPLASAAGVSLEQSAAMIGILANNGIRGSQAGTALARAIKNIAGGKADKIFEELGIQAADADGNLRPIPDLMKEIAEKTKGMGSAQRLKIFEELFGRGSAAAIKLAESGIAFDDLADAITNSSGNAAEAAAKMDAGVGGAFRRLFSALEGVAIGIGEVLAKPLSVIAAMIGEVAGRITEWIAANSQVVIQVAGIVAGLTALAVGLFGVGIAAAVAAFAIGGLGSIIAAVGAMFAFLVSPIGLAIAAVVAGVAAFVTMTETGRNMVSGISSSIGSAVGSVKAFFGSLIESIGLAVELIQAGEIETAFELLWAEVKAVFYSGVAILNSAWAEWKAYFLGIAYDATAKVVGIFDSVWGGIQKGVLYLGAAIAQTWDTVVSGLKIAWFAFVELLVSGISAVASLIGLDSITESITGSAEDWANKQKAEARAHQQRTQARGAAVAEESAAIDQRGADRQERIAEQKEAAIAETRAAADESIAAAEAEADAARMDAAGVRDRATFAAAAAEAAKVDEAEEAGEETDKGSDAITGGGILAEGSEAAVEGTFSGAAAALTMGTGSPMKNVEDILGKILEVNKEIKEEAKETKEATTFSE